MDTQLQADTIPAPDADTEGKAPETPARATPVSALLGEIARAMQSAAEHERERITAGVGEEETAQVEKIHARAAEEATALRKGADDDVKTVKAWCDDEIRRIREAADIRIDDRRSRLEQSLTQHGSLIEAEVQSVHVAVEDYRESLGAFFGRLGDEEDPSEIARMAGTLPEPPDIDAARADARSRAMKALEAEEEAAEPPAPTNGGPPDDAGPVPIDELVPVMDPTVTEGQAWVDAAPPTPAATMSRAVVQPATLQRRTWWLGRSAR